MAANSEKQYVLYELLSEDAWGVHGVFSRRESAVKAKQEYEEKQPGLSLTISDELPLEEIFRLAASKTLKMSRDNFIYFPPSEKHLDKQWVPIAPRDVKTE